jgi:hypothetical protein
MGRPKGADTRLPRGVSLQEPARKSIADNRSNPIPTKLNSLREEDGKRPVFQRKMGMLPRVLKGFFPG